MAYKMTQDLPALSQIPASKKLIAIAAELNSATKSMSTTIEDIEVGLRKLNLGVSAWVPVPAPEDDSFSYSLFYTKHNGRWGLVVRTYTMDHAGDVASFKDTLLMDAPRDVRVNAMGQMESLFLALTKQATELVQKIKKNLDSTDYLAEMMANVPDPKEKKAVTK
jgi:hypothetical protein